MSTGLGAATPALASADLRWKLTAGEYFYGDYAGSDVLHRLPTVTRTQLSTCCARSG